MNKQTPEQFLNEELNKWNGGVSKPLKEEEIDWFSNIDVIEPIKKECEFTIRVVKKDNNG